MESSKIDKNRTCITTVRLTQQEKKLIESYTSKSKVRKSTLIRRCLFEYLKNAG